MEAITNGAEDFLIDGLSFKLPPGASYVTDRKSSTFWATGSNVYKSQSGVKVVKFQLNGDDGNWLDPSSVVFQFEIKNTSADTNKWLRPLGGAHLFFRRLRILSGSLIEDVQDFGRYMEMMLSLQSEGARINDDIQSFGRRWDSPTILQVEDTIKATTTPADIATRDARVAAAKHQLVPFITAGKSKVVNFKILSGLFNQPKYLPLKFLPITLEFELADTEDAIVSPAAYADPWTGLFTPALTSNEWEITNCCIKCDICTLDNSLNNEYTAHLLSGKALPITYSTYISQQSAISGTQFSVQIIRAVSRLQRVFLTFFSNTYSGPFEKSSIIFYHPMHTSGNYDPDKELQIQLQIGSKLIPEYPCQSLSECFYHLKKSLNLPDHHQHSMGIQQKHYRQDKFIVGFSFEKIPDAEWSGINSKAGQILMVNVKALNPANLGDTKIADTMYSVLEAQQILEIRDVGISVYD